MGVQIQTKYNSSRVVQFHIFFPSKCRYRKDQADRFHNTANAVWQGDETEASHFGIGIK